MYSFLIDSFLPLSIMAVFTVAWAAWAVRISTFFLTRFQDWRQGKPNPHEDKETLGLPKGSIRTFFALTFFSLAALAVVAGDRFILDTDKKWILGELGVIMTFYFGSKALDARADAQAKMKAMELASTVDEAMKVIKGKED